MADKKPDLYVIKQALRDELKGAQPLPEQVKVFEFDPEGMRPHEVVRNGLSAGMWKSADAILPPECPVLPLGHNSGTYFFLDSSQQWIALAAKDCVRANLMSLFAGWVGYMKWAWPRIGGEKKDPTITGIKFDACAEDLQRACYLKGIVDPEKAVRGRGAWTKSDGSLVFHCGDQLWESGRMVALGEVDGMIYARRPMVARPWREPMTTEAGPSYDLLTLLMEWEFERPIVDPILLFGFFGAAMMSGAMRWRSMAYLIGDARTGKTTLQKVYKAMCGDYLIQSANATAAGVYQRAQFDALPVALDENEPMGDKTKALLDLARTASDNQLTLRGGASHHGVQFHNRSSFLFSSINQPAFSDADRSRIVQLALKRLPEGKTALKLPDEADLARWGQKLLRRMMDNWPRFDATFQGVVEMLGAAGHDGRGQMTFGTLLACATLMVDCDVSLDERWQTAPPLDGLALGDWEAWRDLFKASGLRENEEAEENWRRCLNHLLTVPFEAWRHSDSPNVAAVLDKFSKGEIGAEELANKKLQPVGLTLMRLDKEGQRLGWKTMVLGISNSHPATALLFRGTPWEGSWLAALRQAPQDCYRVKERIRFGSYASTRGIVFPLGFIADLSADQAAH